MQRIITDQLSCISAGTHNYACADTCPTATIQFLQHCNMDMLRQINLIFKTVLSDPELAMADDETKRAALIQAIESEFLI